MPLFLLLLLMAGLATGSSTVVVKFKTGDVDVERFARTHNMRHVRELGGILAHEHYHEFEARDAGHAHRFVQDVAEQHADIEWSEQQVRRKRFTRTQDPLWRQQWHLHSSNGYGLNIERALAQGIDGSGRTIAIVDDGLDPTHPDLAPNLNMLLSRDFNGNQGTNPAPFPDDTHGTSAAGCAAAARDNGHCGVGVASNATLLGFRLIAAGTTDLEEAEALGLHRSSVDVYSNSWGPSDDGMHMDKPGRLLTEVFGRGVATGLNGRGSVFVWAGGNGKHNGDNCNYDGYASDYRTISVTAIAQDGRSPWYAEECAAHLVAGPSSSSVSGITTVTPGSAECTASFGGTSAAAPMIAGVVACMRQVRPDLSWRDVQGVLAQSAIHTGVASDWSLNARGYRHSHSFGFGHIDLLTTINAARAWRLWSPMRECHLDAVRVQKRIPQGAAEWLSTPIYVQADSECARKISFVESVSLTVGLTHTHRGQIELRLTDSEGVTSRLARQHRDSASNYPREGWTFTSVRHWGTTARGTWRIEVQDAVSDFAVGTLDWFQFTIRGHAE